MHPNLPGLIRVPVFGFLLVCALIVLGTDAHLVDKLTIDENLGFGYKLHTSAPAFTKLGVAVAVLTLVSIAPMLIIDFLRQGAPTSWVGVELGWLGFLWIMWLATAAATADKVDCGGIDNDICSTAQTAEAFSFLAWLVLMAYWGVLLAYAITAYNRGNRGVWQSGVRDADFQAGGGAPAAGGYGGGAPAGHYATPVQQTGQSGVTYPPHNV